MTAPSLPGKQCKNPYLRPPRILPWCYGASFQSPTTTTRTMGIQSQRRNGAIAKCKKRGTKLMTKHRSQHKIENADNFVPSLHCRICRVRHENMKREVENPPRSSLNLPHRSHHKLCPQNRITRGKSVLIGQEKAMDVSSLMFQTVQQRTAALPIAPFNKTTSHGVQSFSQATFLRHEVDLRMKKIADYSWVGTKKYPKVVGLMVDYICTLFEHRKPSSTAASMPSTFALDNAMDTYRQFFIEGSLVFTFPKEVSSFSPSPFYHALEGTTIYHVDWKLAFPSIELLCFECKNIKSGTSNQYLVHDRTNFSKNKSLFPLWTNTGLPSWCVLMNYHCEKCKTTYAANDGRLLAMLQPHVSSCYPVLPIFASGPFHFHQDFSDDLDSLMKTYANAKFVSERMHRKMGLSFERKVHTYLSQLPKLPFLSIKDFLGDISPPTDSAIRQYFLNSELCPLKPYGYSNFKRFECELQSVTVTKNDKIAIDHTFQSVKNYKLPGAKAIFTANKGSTKEIVTLAIVPSTKAQDFSHSMIQSCLKRETFEPGIVYSDTCPSNNDVWKEIFGEDVETRLGLFHLLHRIIDTLDKQSDSFWKCLVDLQKCVYSYYEEDEAALIAVLKDGSFCGQKLCDYDIDNLRHSKRWKQRYSSFLRKKILPEDTIKHRLHMWIVNWDTYSDSHGRHVFTKTTTKVANDQMNKVKHVSDLEGHIYYQEIPAGPQSTHGLSRWRSDRPESPLEKFHEILAHFANSGMKAELADALMLGGTCEYNVKQRFKSWLEESQRKGQSSWSKAPMHYDHAFLHHLNSLAELNGLPPVFANVTVPTCDNGEVFLSKYFQQQVARNKASLKMVNVGSKLCLCKSCNNRHQIKDKNLETFSYIPQKGALITMQEDPQPKLGTVNVNPQLFMKPPAPTQQILLPNPYTNYQHYLPRFIQAPRPTNCCYLVGPTYYCAAFLEYLKKKKEKLHMVRGRPPHDMHCPVKSKKGLYC